MYVPGPSSMAKSGVIGTTPATVTGAGVGSGVGVGSDVGVIMGYSVSASGR